MSRRLLDDRERANYRVAGAMMTAAGLVLLAAHCWAVVWLSYVGAAMFVASVGFWAATRP